MIINNERKKEKQENKLNLSLPTVDMALNMSRGRVLLIVNTRRRKAPLRVQDLSINNSEDLVHLLKRHALSLRDEEPGEEEHREAEGPVDEIRPVSRCANSDHHVRGSASNNEVEQPLGGSGQRDVGGSQARSRDLGDVDPADGSPAKLEKGCEQEDHDNGDVASWRHRDARLRRIEAYVEADVEHGASLGDGSPEKRLAAT